jgi:hypothetical protein
MVDYFSLAVSHAVLMLAFWRLMLREDVDAEPPRQAMPEPDETAPATPARPARKPLRRA